MFLAGALAFLPGLRSPFLLDDYMHAAMVDGTFGRPRGPLDLYDFVNDADRPVLMARGLLPWWAHPRLTIRFFRPLSSALRWAEHSVVGRRIVPLHLHSLAWWAAAVLAARALFRRVLAPRPLLVATWIFALAPCHALPLAWIANREVLLTLTFGALGLAAYARWREERRARDALMATGMFSLAVLAGEYGLAFGGYVLAYELVRRGDGLARRASGVLPFFVPALAYLLVRSALGYGTRGSGFYSDPLHEPWEYLRGAPWRLVALLAQGWLTYNVEPGAGTGEQWGVLALVVVGAAVLFVPARRAFAALEAEGRRTASWMVLGSLLALVPVLAVVPSARLLGISMLGIAPLVALVLERAWFPPAPEARRGAAELTGLVATALGFAHLMHGPSLAWIIAEKHRKDAADFQVHTADLHERIGEVGQADIVVVRGLMGMFFAPFALDARGSAPRRFRPLAHTGHVLVLRRDARTLELVVAADRSLFPAGQGNLFRTDTARMRAGDELPLPGARATVLEVGEFGPRRVSFTFDDDLDTANITWITETFEGFTTAKLPPQGFGAPFDP